MIDLHGFHGTTLRLWLVRVEFVVATIIAAALAVLFIAHGGASGWIIGLIAAGIGTNYLVLAGWAVVLHDPERLAREFAAHDVAVDGRYYSVGQFRLAIPFLLPIMAARAVEREP